MRIAKRLTVTLASVAAAAGMLVATASGEPSSPTVKTGPVHISSRCTNGIYSGYCGTEQNVGDGLGFFFDGSSDWFALQYQGTDGYFFEFAPNGMPSNRCITESGKRVFLSACTGAKTQLFAPTQQTGGFTLTNERFTTFVLQSNGSGQPLTGAVPDGAPDQLWNFTTS